MTFMRGLAESCQPAEWFRRTELLRQAFTDEDIYSGACPLVAAASGRRGDQVGRRKRAADRSFDQAERRH